MDFPATSDLAGLFNGNLHCDLAGLFNGNLLFIELSLELCYQSWYIGAMVGVAACHDVDQGSSQHAVNYKKIIMIMS